MRKHINAKDLLDEAMSKSVEVKIINGDGVEENLENAVTITDLMGIVEYLYPADVVEVVRCKDCRYGWLEDDKDTVRYCSAHNMIKRVDDFCSRGNRRESE